MFDDDFDLDDLIEIDIQYGLFEDDVILQPKEKRKAKEKKCLMSFLKKKKK